MPSALRNRRLAVLAAAALAFSSGAALSAVNILSANAEPASVDALTSAADGRAERPAGAARHRRGQGRGAGDHHRIRLDDLQPLRRLPQGGLAGAEGQIRRDGQGEVHAARVPARSARHRRLHARPLRRAGQARRGRRSPVRPAGRLGLRRRSASSPQGRSRGRGRAGGRSRRLPQESEAARSGQERARASLRRRSGSIRRRPFSSPASASPASIRSKASTGSSRRRRNDGVSHRFSPARG